MSIEKLRDLATRVQLETYDNPEDNRNYGVGPRHEALIRFRKKIVVEHFGSIRDLPVLDLGCGMGQVTEALAVRGVSTVGLDLARNRLKNTASRVSIGHFVCSYGQELPFRNASFGGVCAFEIFEHLIPADSLLMVKEIQRILVPGGKILLSTPNTLSLEARLKKIMGMGPRPDHFNEVSFLEIKDLFVKLGFSEVRTSGIGIIPGMWRMQKLFPFSTIQDLNLTLGFNFPQVASDTLLVANKPKV